MGSVAMTVMGFPSLLGRGMKPRASSVLWMVGMVVNSVGGFRFLVWTDGYLAWGVPGWIFGWGEWF